MRSALRTRRGLTLAELLIVMVILIALSSLLIPMFASTVRGVELDATYATMHQIRDAIIGKGDRLGFMQHMRGVMINGTPHSGIPAKIADLLPQSINSPLLSVNFDPMRQRGWNGPYLQTSSGNDTYVIDNPKGFVSNYGNNGDMVILDSWPWKDAQLTHRGRPIVIQYPQSGNLHKVRLVSAGSNHILDTTTHTEDDLTILTCGDDLVLYLESGWTNYDTLKANLQ